MSAKKNKFSITKVKINKRQIVIYALICISVIAFVIFIFQAFPQFRFGNNKNNNDEIIKNFEEKIQVIEFELFNDQNINENYEIKTTLENIPYTIFLSVTDTTDRANVISSSAPNLERAWEKVVENTKEYLQKEKIDPAWIKIDIVDSIEQVHMMAFQSEVSTFRSEFFRKGVAFDFDMKHAFLEAEINGNKLIDYKTNALDLGTINKYLKYYNKTTIKNLPSTVLLFTTKGWFCDENNNIYELYDYQDKGHDVGRRVIEQFDKEKVEEVILSASSWLGNEIQKDGSFIYGYYPTYDRQFTAYNLLRHTVSIQPLIWQYSMTNDEQILPQIEKTVDYLAKDHIKYLSDEIAYVIDSPNSEIKLGGNGLAIITLEQYMRTFNTDEYLQLCIDLGEGILNLMDPIEGTFYHVLNTDFSPKDEFRIVYYDGEATYALALLYEMTGDTKWLDAAKVAVENFIKNDYTVHRDHWVAYAMNEITKHYDEARYYEFALRNVQENLDTIYHRDTSYHTYLELLMASFILYDRIIENEVNVDYLNEFDEKYFIETIYRRAEHMLNGFIYPEYSMYLKNPQKITGAFFIRHDGYRIRIDDVEHFIAGYHSFYQYYDRLEYYKEKFNISDTP